MRVTTVKMTAEIVVTIHSNWGADCTIGQVKKQALSMAQGELNKTQAAAPKGVSITQPTLHAIIIGD